MTQPTSARVFAATLVAALQQLGLRHVCLSPGARNTPLSLSFAESGVQTWLHHDERSAGFFAIGLARRLGEPVAISCTSGSAAAHFHPAVVEAKGSRVPLLVLTADRPPELRSVGAPQTIDQLELYGSAVKWFHDAGVPDDTSAEAAPHLAAHAWAIASDVPAGPVHLNLPFREPLSSVHDTDVRVGTPSPAETLRGPVDPPEHLVTDIAGRLSGKRVLVIAGAMTDPTFAPAAAEMALAAQAPIHADPLSGLRHGAHDRSTVITSSDLLASSGWLDRSAPEAVVRFGALPTSKPLWRWLEQSKDVFQVLVDQAGWRDPISSADVVLRGDPTATARAFAKLLTPAEPEWLAAWRDADRLAQRVVETRLDDEQAVTEPAVARTLTRLARGVVGVGSSMPIRDVDAFGVSTPHQLHYVANRGTNGIDGLVSMTLGAVAASGAPGHALVGDVGAIHDLTALLTATRLQIPLTTIVVNNRGGGIFHFLPIAAQTTTATFEQLFGTPHDTDFVAVAGAMGMEAIQIGNMAELRQSLDEGSPTPRLLEVRTDRAENHALHRELVTAVGEVTAR